MRSGEQGPNGGHFFRGSPIFHSPLGKELAIDFIKRSGSINEKGIKPVLFGEVLTRRYYG